MRDSIERKRILNILINRLSLFSDAEDLSRVEELCYLITTFMSIVNDLTEKELKDEKIAGKLYEIKGGIK